MSKVIRGSSGEGKVKKFDDAILETVLMAESDEVVAELPDSDDLRQEAFEKQQSDPTVVPDLTIMLRFMEAQTKLLHDIWLATVLLFFPLGAILFVGLYIASMLYRALAL